MSMFDEVRCLYQLPVPVKNAAARVWQTKDAPGYPSLDHYEIRHDGSLWREEYDIEDQSDRWVQMDDFTGELRFYGFKHENKAGENNGWGTGWLEFSAYFVRGKLTQLHVIEDRDS